LKNEGVFALKDFDGLAPIPRQDLPETDAVRIIPDDDPLVCISDTHRDWMEFEPRYYMNGIPGAIPRVYVRQRVYNMLLEAAKRLPAGYKLKIFDAWRPAVVQKSLFYEYYDQVKADPRNANCSEEELLALTRCFVSFPSEDPQAPFVHATGGAVDLTIVDETGRELDMGTDFDDFTDEAHTAYFEASDNITVRNNRRLLYHTMRQVGFTNFFSEWWHYDYGDRFWAALNQTHSVYTGIYEEPEHP
jgi:D-alanyl-D-alanine dipeptidase